MFRLINKLKNRKGFTLIELIVVLAVLAVITAIAVPRFVGVREQAKVDADYSSGSLIAKTAEIYSAKGLTEGAIETKLPEDFPDGIKFQSHDISAKTLADVDITLNASGTVTTVKIGSEIIYPQSDGTLATK